MLPEQLQTHLQMVLTHEEQPPSDHVSMAREY